jgi:hypothetical protein
VVDVQLVPDSRGYVLAAVDGLIGQGWSVVGLPDGGRLARNGQILKLDASQSVGSYRLLIFKVGESGRSRAFERRIEITSTYVGGSLRHVHGVQDVLLGYEPTLDCFVGFDPRRLEHGGGTQNASAFIEGEALRLASAAQVLVVPRDSALFDVEYHAIFKPERLAEYLANMTAIHSGAYNGGGRFSGRYSGVRVNGLPYVAATAATGDAVTLRPPIGKPKSWQVANDEIEALESGLYPRMHGRQVSAEEFQRLLRVMEQNGILGEKVVLDAERRRLRSAGKEELARMVEWTSRENVAAGYDVLSYEIDGSPRHIEVKAVSTAILRFVMTNNEWRTADRLRESYWLYVVAQVRSSPQIYRFQNPVALETAGDLIRGTKDWAVTILKPES